MSARELLVRYRWPGNIRELRNVAEQTVVLIQRDSISSEDLRPNLRGVSSAGNGMGLVPLAGGGNSAEELAGARERELIYRALLEIRGEVKELKEEIAALVAATRTGMPSVQDPGRLLVMHEETGNGGSFIEDAPYEFEPSADDTPEEEEADSKMPTLEDAERTLILSALKRFENNRRQTAEALGISERTLYRKLKEIEASESLD